MGKAPPFVAKQAKSGWIILSNCQIGTAHIDIVLIQPNRGLVLLEIEPHWAPDATAQLRQRLDAAGFTARYPGQLPIIHQRLRPQEVPQLELLLAAAFVWQEAISLEGPGSWEAALKALLSQPASPLPAAPPATLLPEPEPPPAATPPRGRSAALGLVVFGAVGIGLLTMRTIEEAPPGAPAKPAGWDAQPAMPGMPPWSPASAGLVVAALPRDAEAIPDAPTAAEMATVQNAPTPPPEPGWLGTLPIPEPEDVLAAIEPPQPPAGEPPSADAAMAAPADPSPTMDAPWPDPIAAPEPAAPEPAAPAPSAEAPSAPAPLAEEPTPPVPADAPTDVAALPAPPQAAAPAAPQPLIPIPPALVAAMLHRGESLMGLGDISGARRFFERAAAAGSAAAAQALAETYDPRMLARRGTFGIEPDPAAARHWYGRAEVLRTAKTPPLTKSPEERL